MQKSTSLNIIILLLDFYEFHLTVESRATIFPWSTIKRIKHADAIPTRLF